jgi:hypothetical protein
VLSYKLHNSVALCLVKMNPVDIGWKAEWTAGRAFSTPSVWCPVLLCEKEKFIAGSAAGCQENWNTFVVGGGGGRKERDVLQKINTYGK